MICQLYFHDFSTTRERIYDTPHLGFLGGSGQEDGEALDFSRARGVPRLRRERYLDVVLKGLPFISGAVSMVFAFLVFRRFVVRHGLHLLLWGIGLVFYAIGGLCEALNGALGWSPVV